jgi:transposase
MEQEYLFALALGIKAPFFVSEVKFLTDEDGSRELNIYVDFVVGSTFMSSCGTACKAHDTRFRTWQHLNFFEHKTYLHCHVPRIKRPDGKVEQVSVSWARPSSGFTLQLESDFMDLIHAEMPVSHVARRYGIYDKRVWTVFRHWVDKAVSSADHSGITRIGVDETSRRKGHKYITVAVDLDTKAAFFVTLGKDASTLKATAEHMEKAGSPAKEVSDVSIDLSPAFISGSRENFPNAAVTFDRFHVKKLVNVAMDEVRRQEAAKARADFKGQRYVFLKNSANLSDRQRAERERLAAAYPNVGEAYRLKTMFDELWTKKDKDEAEDFLLEWMSQASVSLMAPFEKLVNTITAHFDGIIQYVESKINNGILEGINSKIQLAKKRARGFSNTENFIRMVYMVAGKLRFDYPH